MTKERPNKEKETRKSPPYSVTEVGTLLESMDKKIDQIAEGHVGLNQGLEKLEIAVHGNSRRLDHLELGFSVLNGKTTRLEDAVSLLSKDLKGTRTELGETRKELEETRKELGTKIDDLGNRLTAVESRP